MLSPIIHEHDQCRASAPRGAAASRSPSCERDAALGRVARARRWLIVGAAAADGRDSPRPCLRARRGDTLGARASQRRCGARATASASSSAEMPPLASPAQLGLQGPEEGPQPSSIGQSRRPAAPARRRQSATRAAPPRRRRPRRPPRCPAAPEPATRAALPCPKSAVIDNQASASRRSAAPRRRRRRPGAARGRARGGRRATDRRLRPRLLAVSRRLGAVGRSTAAAGSAVRVSPLLLRRGRAGVRAARLTDGDVDPTVGQALIALGYDRDFDEVAGAPAPRRVSIAAVPGWRTVEVDRVRSTVRVPRGVSLDLGATAKALAADRAAAPRSRPRAVACLSASAGTWRSPAPAPAGGWRVRVTDDHRAGRSTRPVSGSRCSSGGLATSSTTVRRWRAATGTAHHVVDPSTGAPADEVWRTVSVSAPVVPRREHRQHSSDRPRRGGGRVARVAGASEPSRPG